jgi:hypothetical protein
LYTGMRIDTMGKTECEIGFLPILFRDEFITFCDILFSRSG